MIRNDRQYRITKSQAEEFERSIGSLSATPPPGIAPVIHRAQLDALRSQLEELRVELAEYDALKSGSQRVLELTSLDELPQALIRGRIASGMTQRQLAERLGLKEQQIQRYEATNYMSASLARIKEVVNAIGLKVREDVFLPSVDTSFGTLVKRLRDVGLDEEFIRARLIAVNDLDVLHGEDTEATEGLGLRLSAIVNRVFGWNPALIFGEQRSLSMPRSLAVRFKVPANAEGRRTLVQAVYARYLASLVVQATPQVQPQKVPTDASRVRREIADFRGELSLGAYLDYAWKHGIAVLPLRQVGGFHGATWRLAGRNVIVLKQTTRSTARWLHDFLHEFRHAGEEPAASEFEAIDMEVVPQERRESPEEKDATTFAGDVLLDGRAEELAEKCVKEARGRLELLKSAVPVVASREAVRTDVLANYMAYRLALQGENWWGAATNLQVTDDDPWLAARQFLMERLNLGKLDDVDRQLLIRALEGE